MNTWAEGAAQGTEGCRSAEVCGGRGVPRTLWLTLRLIFQLRYPLVENPISPDRTASNLLL